MPNDNPLTAAELREIGERVAQSKPSGWKDAMQAYRDRARLCAALERLVEPAGENCFAIVVPSRLLHMTRDEAIDALLKQGGGE